MSENFQKLREIVLQNVDLQKKLQMIEDREEFIETLVELGQEYNLQIENEDVSHTMQENRRVWIERWI